MLVSLSWQFALPCCPVVLLFALIRSFSTLGLTNFVQLGLLLPFVLLAGIVSQTNGCGLPPAPAPPPPMCCPCAPPAPPPPACCPCPPPPPPPPACGGGCAVARRRMLYTSAAMRKFWRNKRQANETALLIGQQLEQPSPVMIRDGQIPCPQAEWAPHMRQAIIPEDAYASVHSIQAVLMREVDAHDKFLVTCARPEALGGGDDRVLPAGVQLSSSGDAFCSVRAAHQEHSPMWCQAAAVIA